MAVAHQLPKGVRPEITAIEKYVFSELFMFSICVKAMFQLVWLISLAATFLDNDRREGAIPFVVILVAELLIFRWFPGIPGGLGKGQEEVQEGQEMLN